MNKLIKIITASIFVLFLGLQGCYDDYVKDFDYSAVYFGAQRPLRTLVTRIDENELLFKIGVGLGGVRENRKGYEVQYMLDPGLLTTIEGADKLTLLPENVYTIENNNDFTFHIPAGEVIGDHQVKINKDAFIALQGSLDVTWALPFRLLSTTADSILENKDWTIIALKYIDEHSGNYYCRGWQARWDGTSIVEGTTIDYFQNDWSRNNVRALKTLSPTEFDMAGMGNINDAITASDHLLIKLADGEVTLEQASGTANGIEDLGSIYDPGEKIFTLDYVYTKGAVSYRVHEQLKLRQDVEKELRFEEWSEN